MKSYSQILESLNEHVRVPKNQSPEFQKLSDKYLSSRPMKLETKSFRFHIKDHQDPKDTSTGLITVHDHDGNHVGSMSYSKYQKSGHIISELTKDKNSKHDHMMAEVMSHLHQNHGYKFFGSHSVSQDGERPWHTLAKTHHVHVLAGKNSLRMKAKSVSPDDIKSGKYLQTPDKMDKEDITQYWLGERK